MENNNHKGKLNCILQYNGSKYPYKTATKLEKLYITYRLSAALVLMGMHKGNTGSFLFGPFNLQRKCGRKIQRIAYIMCSWWENNGSQWKNSLRFLLDNNPLKCLYSCLNNTLVIPCTGKLWTAQSFLNYPYMIPLLFSLSKEIMLFSLFVLFFFSLSLSHWFPSWIMVSERMY